MNGFKNLVAVCAESGYEFEQATALLNAAKNAPAVASGPATGAPAAAKEPSKKSEEEAVDMGGLFGDDDEY